VKALAASLLVLGIVIGPNLQARGGHHKMSPEQVFNKKDVNHDGKLSLTEFLSDTRNITKDKKRFAALDKDGDGFLTPAEFVVKHKKHGSSSKAS
jgi:Ca2+-binding EF-hand superfamily protein